MNFKEIIAPKTLGDLLIPDATVSILKRWELDTTRRSSLILYGPPGCGKSTCLRILASDMDVLHLTATVSADNRPFMTAAMSFSRSVSLHDQGKVLVIDELDALTEKEQRMVSSILDETHCILLASSNFPDRIYAALKSRSITLNFDPNQLPLVEIAQRLKQNITNALHLSGANVGADVVDRSIMEGFPDFRKIGYLLNATA